MVKLSSGNYIKSDEIKRGDRITILNEGEWVDSTKFFVTDSEGNQVQDESGNPIPKPNFEVKIKLPNGKEGKINMNKTSRDLICQIYGEETNKWVGKEIIAYPTLTPNKKRMIMFYVETAQLVDLGLE